MTAYFDNEMHMRTYNNHEGSFIEVRDDQDGLGLAELRWVEPDGREHARLTLPVEMLEKFLSAAKVYIDYRKENPLT